MAIIGIDLGTTNSAVAYLKEGRPEIIENRDGDRTTPSAVGIGFNNEIIIGTNAKNSLISMPDRTIIEVKRKMGTEEKITLAGQQFRPEEVSALILKELKWYAEQKLGEAVTEAVITVPAYFTDTQRKATQKAGELAGLIVERIINEPTAAAIAYGMENMDKEQHLLVYDLGGGTFDVSVVEMFEGILEVKASAGNNQLGGMDFDNALTEWLTEKVKKVHQIDLLNTGNPSADLQNRWRLKLEMERVKKLLSNQMSTTISLPFIAMKDGVPFSINEEITREEFEKLILSMAESTLVEVDKALADAKLSLSQIDEVLLVGGSTRIPLIQQLITKKFNKAPRKDLNPDEAVALGATIQGGIKSGEISSVNGLMVTDVSPHSLGMEVVEMIGGQMVPGFFDVIIPRNSTIPITKSKLYYTVNDNQTEVDVGIFQGESPKVKDNLLLGQFELSGIPAGAQGKEAIELTIRYDINGTLQIDAQIQSTGKKISQIIDQQLGVMSQAEVAVAKERIHANWDQSELYKDVKPAIQRAEKMLPELNELNRNKIEGLLQQLKGALSTNDKVKVQKLDEELTDLLIELV
ncbi:MAG: Hsp70 family protein [Candidatus Cohnella colombiensis]|uniref:Chaperone protein DnaK n=1 Tax=Candidatus Cohnella colombiensis TaxID=3121368 RepID=A0AA95JGL6_9BACL|nr:MAG: Hsp70 family protein [Cohnella sp.]